MTRDDPLYRRRVRSWCLYDWANSAFATTVMAGFFPPFYRSLVLQAGLSEAEATAFWGYTAAAGLALVALVSPLLGAAADHAGRHKSFLATFMGAGVLATFGFAFLGETNWAAATLLFIIGNVGFAGGNVFYDALLPHLAAPHDLDRVSTTGYAVGYLGGGLLLGLNLLWYLYPQVFGLPSATAAVRLSFISVGVWWFAFTLPLLFHVPGPAVVNNQGTHRGNSLSAAARRLVETLRHLGHYRQALLFLVAYLIYSDGIGTVIKMATAYGDALGLELGHMIAALVITQVVGIPAAFAFGFMARLISAKRAIFVGLVIYTGICLGAYFMDTAAEFYLLAFLVGLTQGGTQALSRSLFGSMVPKSRSAEFFGFFSTGSKFAGIFGPLVFGLVAHSTGQSRMAILPVAGFFIVGALLLLPVNVKRGVEAAQFQERTG